MKHICKNCRHYVAPKDEDDIKEDKGKCNSKKFIYDASFKDYPLDDKLEYWDYEGYSAGFAVGQNFGCIHFLTKN